MSVRRGVRVCASTFKRLHKRRLRIAGIRISVLSTLLIYVAPVFNDRASNEGDTQRAWSTPCTEEGGLRTSLHPSLESALNQWYKEVVGDDDYGDNGDEDDNKDANNEDVDDDNDVYDDDYDCDNNDSYGDDDDDDDE